MPKKCFAVFHDAGRSAIITPFTGEAERKRAGFQRRTGRIIKPITVQEILDEQFVQKM